MQNHFFLTEDKKHVCPKCSKTFDDKSNYNRHVLNHEKNTYQSILPNALKTPENYINMKLMIQKVKLNTLIQYLLVADLKLLNIVCGLGTHSSKYPCPYGQCFRQGNGIWVAGRRRTVRSIKENFQRWKAAGSKQKKKKNFYSCEEEPLIKVNEGDEYKEILGTCPPPPLHLLLGVANHVWKQLEKKFPGMKDFQKSLHLQKASYQDKSKYD